MMNKLLQSSIATMVMLFGATSYGQTVPGTSIPYTQINTWGVTSPTGAGSSVLALGYGNIVVESAQGWGGAIYTYAANGSGNLVNRHDAGRLWQSMINVYEPTTGLYVNPTEAGDRHNRGSAVVQYANATTAPYNVQYTKSTPFGFLAQPGEDDLGGTSPTSGNVAVQFNGMTIGKELTLAFNGDNNVARYVAKVFSNASAPRVTGNLPILYLPGNFQVFSTYDATNGSWLPQAVPSTKGLTGVAPDVLSQSDAASCRGIIAENTDRSTGVAIYGCRPGTRNGGAFHLAFANVTGTPASADPFHDDTVALMSQLTWGDNVGLPIGESSLTTYIIVCRGALAGVGCVNSMAALYSAGY